ncbi:UTP--glucose-1-phosphate uridylyltransferase [Simkania sp.]|uniref:UTP--glucose-1-phosphate uridylyltransferase n=1 Tax=Simkania sp. TaxID=34094 RepID=UPI003B520687
MNKHPLAEVKQILQQSPAASPHDFSPVASERVVRELALSHDFEKMGVLILAGGQGTRLGFEGPKGCFELPLEEKKSIFQIHFERIKSKGTNLSVAIMTSPLNHEATLAYLQANDYFGLSPSQVDLYQQELIPMCDDQGYLFYEAPDKIAEAPAGNGKALFHLYGTPIWEKWRQKGVEYIQVVPVDNPLAEPFDGELLACHVEDHLDLALKCIERVNPEEKLGVIVEKQGKLMIREYSEVSDSVRMGRSGERLTYNLGNSGLFSCSMDYIERLIEGAFEMPWHLAHKKGKRLISTPDGWKTEEAWIWKFETFIFDIFPYADSFRVIVGDRKKCFAPLKNLSGPDNPQIVADAIVNALISEKS